MKYYISFDYEGLAGVTNWQETYGNQRFNQLATEQMNSFLKGIFDSEPEAEVVVADSHANGDNLIWEKLVGNTRLIKGYPRTYYMIEGLDKSFDSLILFGYHAPVGMPGNMDHTYSASSFYSVEINGNKVSEICINAMTAAEIGVPLQFVYTDDITSNWLHENVDQEIKILVSKKAISRYAAELYSHQEILKKLFESGKKLTSFPNYFYQLSDNYSCKIQGIDTNIAYACAMVPGVELLDPRTLIFESKDMQTLYRYLMTLCMAAGSVNNLYR
ncbi:MAG: M55 family metallopeptidase [Candidatus Cloacimonetes bacterium]|nr:M55 family metallopeptidase [Candidatus Cloacimonadota bacterium]MCF7813136.1 M55 family metallopeptidase [Candidatus Cloacimonadota bacterium]MCF7867584.1 M55 family metallopeptidase [Candidatus Cloacimonadota bacterium]MCF7883141.1 M55 family metallopeptidase [Candidatus Cloacimonadota bacterium]